MKVKFYTLGCKVNQYDTQEIRERFLEAGYQEAQGKQAADVYVVNTCTVTAKADKDSLYYIHRSHRENPKARLIVTGCLAQLEAKRIKAQPGVSLVVPNKNKKKILSLLSGSRAGKEQGISFFAGHTRVFLKIQDGCNNFCSYCRVPLARGVSRSRTLEDILEEARRLVQSGFREIVLTGICLGSFGRDLKPQRNLVEVISALEEINDLLRIRLSSIEAGDITDELIEKIRGSAKLCRHLHIPIQSGDNLILGKMRRKYTHQGYLELVRKLKKRVPGLAVTTDVLVGFPGESEENFRNTLSLVKKIKPLRAHIFPFSPRPQTTACNFPDIPKDGKVKERIQRLRRICEKLSRSFRRKSLGKKTTVLIEGPDPEKPGFWEGYTDTYLKVSLRSGENLKNQLVTCRLGNKKAPKIVK